VLGGHLLSSIKVDVDNRDQLHPLGQLTDN